MLMAYHPVDLKLLAKLPNQSPKLPYPAHVLLLPAGHLLPHVYLWIWKPKTSSKAIDQSPCTLPNRHTRCCCYLQDIFNPTNAYDLSKFEASYTDKKTVGISFENSVSVGKCQNEACHCCAITSCASHVTKDTLSGEGGSLGSGDLRLQSCAADQ
jgi:hypothetical protein